MGHEIMTVILSHDCIESDLQLSGLSRIIPSRLSHPFNSINILMLRHRSEYLNPYGQLYSGSAQLARWRIYAQIFKNPFTEEACASSNDDPILVGLAWPPSQSRLCSFKLRCRHVLNLTLDNFEQ